MDNRTKLRYLMLLQLIVMHSASGLWLLYLWYLYCVSMRRNSRGRRGRTWQYIERQSAMYATLAKLTEISDMNCHDNLRMNRDTFRRLCYLLEHMGGLNNERWVPIPAKVALFLFILAHHEKNRVVKGVFHMSGHTVSKYFKQTLRAVLRISSLLLVKPMPIGDDCNTEPWKYFKGCLGALDGTYIDVQVPLKDQARYRTRKGGLSVNVLGVVNKDMNFTYILAGWEGSAADSRVLRDAVTKPNGLRVPQGHYYLCDCGYTNAEGFLTPYRGTRYHLKEWGVGRLAPQNDKELFNLRHSKARNIIERAFSLLKGRWAILRSKSFYPIKIQNRCILACALLHNFIRTHMEIDPQMEERLIEENPLISDESEYIGSIEPTVAWRDYRDGMANSMFNTYRH